MRALRFGSNSAVFVLFFGVALLEALRHADWVFALIFLALGIMSVRSDTKQPTTP